MLAAMMQQQGMMAGHQQWSAQSGQQWGGAANPQALMAQQALMAAQGGMGSGIPNMGMPMSPGMMQMNMAHQNRRNLLLAAQTHAGGSSGEHAGPEPRVGVARAWRGRRAQSSGA